MNRQVFNTATPPHWRATMSRRSLLLPLVMRRSLCSLMLPALFVVCGQAQAQQATGEPAVAYASGITVPTQGSPITASRGSIEDSHGLTTFIPTLWEWRVADTHGGAYAAYRPADSLNVATATFAPLQIHVGKFLEVCAAFNDDRGFNEKRCHRIATAVANVNDAPSAKDVTHHIARTAGSNTAAIPVTPFVTAFSDPDGAGDMLGAVIIAELPADGSTLQLAGASATTDLAVNASLALNTARDGFAGGAFNITLPNGVHRTSFKFRLSDGSLSSNDATITIGLISATQTAAAGAPTVAAADSTATAYQRGVQLTATIDGIIEPNGINESTLSWRWRFAAASATGAPADGDYADIADATAATYTPISSQVGGYIRACASYMDLHSSAPASEMRCSAPAVITPAVQMPPTGQPDLGHGVVAPGQTLAINLGTVSDPDDININTLELQWQSAAAPAAGGRPADEDYADLEGETIAVYMVTRAQVGRYIRACVWYMDLHSTPVREGPVCSNGRLVNAPPTSVDAAVSVSTTATEAEPYVFKESDFPYRDAEGDSLASVTISSLPTAGTLRVGGADARVNQIVPAADIGTITYWPAAGQSAQTGYATFRFRVSDGNAGSAFRTMTIHLGFLSLRLRLFLEGPLR